MPKFLKSLFSQKDTKIPICTHKHGITYKILNKFLLRPRLYGAYAPWGALFYCMGCTGILICVNGNAAAAGTDLTSVRM